MSLPPVYVARVNIPGYLPEGDMPGFASMADAWSWLAEERNRDLDSDAELYTMDGDGSDSCLEEIEGLIESPELGYAHGFMPSDADSPHSLGLMYVVSKVDHADYPHEAGYLIGCAACEAMCWCAEDPSRAECVYGGEHV